jgi:glycosyltransferase involved in cell wall biosynthesis
MRVLMISSHHMGGRYFEDFTKGAIDSEIELGFMWLSKDEPSKWIEEYGVRDLSNRFLESRSFILQCVGGIYAIYKFKPDIIQTHLFRAGILGILLGKVMQKPIILTRHHITEHLEVGSKLHRTLDRYSGRMANFIIVFSNAAQKWLINIEGIDPKKIFIINQGFNFQKLSPTSEEISRASRLLGFSGDTFNLVCVARYSETKGQRYLVEAIRELISVIPEIRLVFIGPGESEWLAQIVEELGMNDFIRLTGYNSDVPACLAAADLVVHPSLVDAFSQLLIEAQGVGVPLIATDIAAAREQIIDGVTGIIVKERSSSELAAAINRLYLDRGLMAELGFNASKSVRERFSVARMIKESQDCYRVVSSRN